MFEIGDIVRPKKGFKGHDYCFKIIESEINPFDDIFYKLQRVAKILDPTKGPLNLQLKIIRNVEATFWREKDLELTSDIKLRYDENVLDDILDANKINLDDFAKTLKSYEVKINKEEKEMQILDLYEKRKVKALEKEILEAKSKVKEQDEIQSIILEMTNQVNTILENQGRKTIYEFEPNLITLETEAKLDELEKEHHKQIEELRSTLDEIRALFELTDDYNERIKILKNYNILDKKGKLNV